MDEKQANDLVQKSLWKIIKALPFDGGPSSTRWVFLCAGAILGIVVLALGLSFCLVYLRSHIADVVFAGALAGALTAFIGFATSAQNNRNKLALGDKPPDVPPPQS